MVPSLYYLSCRPRINVYAYDMDIELFRYCSTLQIIEQTQEALASKSKQEEALEDLFLDSEEEALLFECFCRGFKSPRQVSQIQSPKRRKTSKSTSKKKVVSWSCPLVTEVFCYDQEA